MLTGDIVVIGGGVAGAAIARMLHERRDPVRLITAPMQGASYKNQKWLHSGALYPSATFAEDVWDEYRRNEARFARHVVSPNQSDAASPSARFLALNATVLEAQSGRLTNLLASDFCWEKLVPEQCAKVGELSTNATCGRLARDVVVDFPGLIEKFMDEIERDRVINGTALQIETEGADRAVSGIRYRTDGGSEGHIPCRRCIVAAGAWTPMLLTQSNITLRKQIIRKKCIIFVFEGELVPGITVCYDIVPSYPNIRNRFADVSLVPYKGTTLGAGVGWTRLGDEEDPDTVTPTMDEKRYLMSDLLQAFPTLASKPRTAHACIKTELDTGTDRPDASPQIFGVDDHGVRGLFVTLPGKASLMFELADKVLKALNYEHADAG